jgi:integrase
LRHALAALMVCVAGWKPERLQQAMGHSSLAVTMNLYHYLFRDGQADRDAMAMLDAKLAATD